MFPLNIRSFTLKYGPFSKHHITTDVLVGTVTPSKVNKNLLLRVAVCLQWHFSLALTVNEHIFIWESLLNLQSLVYKHLVEIFPVRSGSSHFCSDRFGVPLELSSLFWSINLDTSVWLSVRLRCRVTGGWFAASIFNDEARKLYLRFGDLISIASIHFCLYGCLYVHGTAEKVDGKAQFHEAKMSFSHFWIICFSPDHLLTSPLTV